MFIFIIFCIAAYLLGSLSSAILICRCFHLPDPREYGSHNPGTTNVLRLGGKWPALATLAGDMLKGFIPVLLAKVVFGIEGIQLASIGLAAFLGHLYPIFFHFHGGKGVATYLGVVLAMDILLGGMTIATWLLVAVIFRYSSLAALIAALLTPIYAWIMDQPGYVLPLAVMTLLIYWRHWGNIGRLYHGTEQKIGSKSAP